MSSDSEESLVASNPPAASAAKSKNSKGTRKPPAKRNPADKSVRGTVADQLKKKPKEVRNSIFKVSRRTSNMNREVFLTQAAEAVDLMQEAFKGIRDGVGKWNETAHFIKICGEILTPIQEFHFALGGKARRRPAKAPPQKKPPVPGRVDATAATKVVCIEEKPLVPVADESKSESSSDDENEDDVDESSQDEEEEEDEEECNLAGCTRPAKDGASSAAPLRVEDDDGAPPASSLQPRVARPPRVEPSSSPQRKAVAPPTDDDDEGGPPAACLQPRATARVDVGTPPPFKKFASAAANLAGQAAVAAVGLTLQGAAAASGLTLKGAAAASGYALHGAAAASGLALHGAAAGGNMVVRHVAAAMTAPQPQARAPAPGQGPKRRKTLQEMLAEEQTVRILLPNDDQGQ